MAASGVRTPFLKRMMDWVNHTGKPLSIYGMGDTGFEPVTPSV
jgi:hypothetical protein